jgi:hypothetical protein
MWSNLTVVYCIFFDLIHKIGYKLYVGYFSLIKYMYYIQFLVMMIVRSFFYCFKQIWPYMVYARV